MANLIFVGQFIASKTGKTGLPVTVDVDRYSLTDGTWTTLVTAGSPTESRRGLYFYRLTGADLAEYQYVATFITADETVDQKAIAALGLVIPDTLVSSRLAPTISGRTVAVDENGATTPLAAAVRGAVGMAAADFDSQLDSVSAAIEESQQPVLSAIASVVAAIAALNDMSPAEVLSQVLAGLLQFGSARPGDPMTIARRPSE